MGRPGIKHLLVVYLWAGVKEQRVVPFGEVLAEINRYNWVLAGGGFG